MTIKARDIMVRPVTSRAARRLICRGHYSGKTGHNSQVHLGVFVGDRLMGALQFGPPINRRGMLGLVSGSEWGSMCELNRMWLHEDLPKNSESRALGAALRMLRKQAPQIKWVVSFADASQCGDGAIYRASGFVLTLIKPTQGLARLPSGEVVHWLAVLTTATKPRKELRGRTLLDVCAGSPAFRDYCKAAGAEQVSGYQFRYVRFLDPTWRERLTVPEIPFAEIPAGCRMYRGRHVAAP